MSRKLTILILFILTCFLFSSCQSKPITYSDTGFYFDTVITITLYENGSEEILEECMELAEHYEHLLSATIQGSDIWNLNHYQGTYITLSPETIDLLNASLTYARLSDGAVDPTVGALSSLWNFGSDSTATVPEAPAILNALSHVNYQTLSIQGNEAMLLDSEASIDLGFIAKGYIGEQIKAFLVSRGVTSALINLGGNVVTIGTKPDGTPFRIGIQDPFEPSGTATLSLELSDESAVSAGNYERYFEQEGIRYHHILSTENGYPVSSGLSQVTIICKDSTKADALSTLCFILGYEKAASLLESFPDVRAVFITEDGEVLYVN